MLTVFKVKADEHAGDVRALFWEYLQWANDMVAREFGVSFDIATMLEEDMRTLAKFSPPQGRLLLATYDGQLAGIAGLRTIGVQTGEIKRMFVRPAFRAKGIGRALVEELIAEARQMELRTICLDSARFMTAAHALYRSLGFCEIAAYPGSEIPQEFQANWVFMERTVR